MYTPGESDFVVGVLGKDCEGGRGRVWGFMGGCVCVCVYMEKRSTFESF